MNLVFPILPFMIADFYPDMKHEDLGYLVGVLAAAFFLGTTIMAPVWGRIADKVGRKPPLLLCCAMAFFTLAGFGFSKNYVMAFLLRFLWGIFSGNVPIARTMLGEVCGKEHQFIGFSVIGVCFGIGSLVGPSIGGLLSNPADNFELFQGNAFFQTYPYLLPCLVAAGVSATSFFVILIFVPETLENPPWCQKRSCALQEQDAGEGAIVGGDGNCGGEARAEEEAAAVTAAAAAAAAVAEEKAVGLEASVAIVVGVGASETAEVEVRKEKDEEDDGCAVFLEEDTSDAAAAMSGAAESAGADADADADVEADADSDSDETQTPDAAQKQTQTPDAHADAEADADTDADSSAAAAAAEAAIVGNAAVESALSPSQATPPPPSLPLAIDRPASKPESHERCCSFCTGRVFLSVMLFSVWGFSSVALKEIIPLWMLAPKRAHGFDFNVREIGLLFTIAGCAVLPAQLFIYQGVAKRIGVVWLSRACIVVVVPMVLLLPHISALRNVSTTASWWLIAIVNCVIQVCFTFVNTGWLVWINNSCPAEHRGTVNGVAQSCVSMGRAAGPATMGALLALTMGGGLPWPFNHHFSYIVTALIACFVFTMMVFAPVALDPRMEKERIAVAAAREARRNVLLRLARAGAHGGVALDAEERPLLAHICAYAAVTPATREGCLLRAHDAMRAWATRRLCSCCIKRGCV